MPRTLSSRALAALLVATIACTSNPEDGETIPPPPPASPKFTVIGADLSAGLQNAYVSLDGVSATGLTVTVNGTTLADAGGGLYHGNLPAAIPTGGAIQIQVTNGTLTATGSATIPDAPATTAATAASRGDPLLVTWTSATSPDSFVVTLNYTLPDQSSTGITTWIGGSQRQASLATTSIPAGASNFYIGLEALRNGTFTGAATPNSSMHVRAESPSFPFTLP
jgi:hypothetical protein